jgi:hypothetical protein
MENTRIALMPEIITVVLDQIYVGTTGDSIGASKGQYSAGDQHPFRVLISRQELVEDLVIDYPDIKRDSKVMGDLKRIPA